MIVDELKQEEAKYRAFYEGKSQHNYILDGIKADVFRLAINRIQSKGIKDTYHFLKEQRDKFSQSTDRLGANLAHAYGLVLGKLWKEYQKIIKEDEKNAANTAANNPRP